MCVLSPSLPLKVKRHSELYVADADGAAAILNALVFLGNETFDQHSFENATSHGLTVVGGGHANKGGKGSAGKNFQLPISESELLYQEDLSNSTLARLRYSSAFVLAATASRDGLAWRGNGEKTSSSSSTPQQQQQQQRGAVVGSVTGGGLSEEAEYALRQHLTKRGIAVQRLLSQEDKQKARESTPGSLDYRRAVSGGGGVEGGGGGSSSQVEFVECASRTSAYSAAW
jgi:hypothetical protein